MTDPSLVREQSTVFVRGSNVLEYWLAHAEGFEVASRRVRPARVEWVVVDPVQGRATRLVVVLGRSRRRIVAADAVVAVDPFRRTLHLADVEAERTRRPAAQLLRAVSVAAGVARGWLAPRLRQSTSATAAYARELGVGIGAGVAWLRPRLRALASAAWVLLVGLSCATANGGRRVYTRLVDHASGSS